MEEIFKQIVEELKKYDFIISTYHSCTTNSVYIKLDYGLANGIRIADHRGKKKYKYRYNVMNDLKEDYMAIDDGFERYYFMPSNIKKMILKIVLYKQSKICKYGIDKYKMYMEKMKQEEVNKRFKEVEYGNTCINFR